MSGTARRYVPAGTACLVFGIGGPFVVAALAWAVLRPLDGFGILALGVLAAVAGMLLAGLCARAAERAALGPPTGAPDGAAPAPGTDPMRDMEARTAGREQSDA